MELPKLTVKRITNDIKHFYTNKPELLDIYPNEKNMLEIYFLICVRPDSPYAGGQYIGKIVHNPLYPRKAPDYYMLTPNGRFATGTKICLTNSSFHDYDWAPTWNLVTMLEGLSSVWHSEFKDDLIGIAHIKSSPQVIKQYAQDSIEYNKTHLIELYSNFPSIKNPEKNQEKNIEI
jgi:ubiquitin-conjugating enzyme E2 J2